MKKKFDGKEYTQKRKKVKKSKSVAVGENNETVRAEVLDVKGLREETILLGCVIEVQSNRFLISLPGCVKGNVPATGVSSEFTDRLRRCAAGNGEEEEPCLENIVKVGEIYPCKVIKVVPRSDKIKKPFINLSIDPSDINKDLRLHSLYLKMVLYAAVQSVEDHGYVMDLGIKGAQGFMPFREGARLSVGQVVPTAVQKLPSFKNGNVIWLTKLNQNEPFPQVEDESLKLSSILPGASVTACISHVKQPFIYMNCMNFNACANIASLGSSSRNFKEGTMVSGIVLFVHPISHMIHLLVAPRPTPQTFPHFFRAHKYDLLKNVKFEYDSHGRLFFKIHQEALGFIKKAELQEKGEFSQESLLKTPTVPRARVIFLHYMDNLVQISFKESWLDLKVVRPEEVKVGDIYEGVVTKHTEFGMFVKVCPGLTGLVHRTHMSDATVTMPEKLHPLNSKIKCRVLFKDQEKSRFSLTSKESFLKLPDSQLLSSYEEAESGHSYKGVITQKTDAYIFILFFNNVKGVVSTEDVPESSVLYVGQTISCSVLYCNPAKQRLKLSLTGVEKKRPIEVTKSVPKLTSQAATSSDISSMSCKARKATVCKVTAHQLLVTVEGKFKGRVHITELGFPEEECLPLKKFSVGQGLKVYCLGTYNRRTRAFLHITHRSTQEYLECSLQYPPPVPLTGKILPGMKLKGFIKEMGSNCAIVWLSPTQVGVLDFLHVSQNPKVLRRVKKRLKVGLSIEVTVLEVQPRGKNNFFTNVKLTKLGEMRIKTGQNIVGYVECASPKEGLVLQLPHGYHGTVCLTDLHDVYAPVNTLLTKYQKLKYIFCYVLEVNHDTKNCSLSLRKSRLYGTDMPKDGCSELYAEDMVAGKRVRGFVQKVTANFIFLTLGRGLEGKISVHQCPALSCALCDHTQGVLAECPPGSILEVLVDGEKTKKGFYPLLLPALTKMKNSTPSRLQIMEDIDWNDI